MNEYRHVKGHLIGGPPKVCTWSQSKAMHLPGLLSKFERRDIGSEELVHLIDAAAQILISSVLDLAHLLGCTPSGTSLDSIAAPAEVRGFQPTAWHVMHRVCGVLSLAVLVAWRVVACILLRIGECLEVEGFHVGDADLAREAAICVHVRLVGIAAFSPVALAMESPGVAVFVVVLALIFVALDLCQLVVSWCWRLWCRWCLNQLARGLNQFSTPPAAAGLSWLIPPAPACNCSCGGRRFRWWCRWGFGGRIVVAIPVVLAITFITTVVITTVVTALTGDRTFISYSTAIRERCFASIFRTVFFTPVWVSGR